MVSVSAEVWFETPGSTILKSRQMSDTPDREYLMNLQGMFSGKTEGDLDSIPGYYGGTASYKFVQNAHAVRQHRALRRRAARSAAAEDAAENLQSHLTPSDARVAAYQSARSKALKKKAVKSKARGTEYKYAGQFGATTRPRGKEGDPTKQIRRGVWYTDESGNRVFDPERVVEVAAKTRVAKPQMGVPV